MATWLEDYRAVKMKLDPLAEQGNLSIAQIIEYQELTYRIEVLETCQLLCKTAPLTTDMAMIVDHYRIVDAYMQCIGRERLLGKPADDKLMTIRKTTGEVYSKILIDSRRRFANFQATNLESYKSNICTFIGTLLPAWLQMRNSYTQLNSKENSK